MNLYLENLFLIASAIGFLLGAAMLTHIFRPKKANFFLGLILFLIACQLLFSWGSYSGYNADPGNFPFWVFLSYYILPASLWLFTRLNQDPQFSLKKWHLMLFLPALVEISIHIYIQLIAGSISVNLMEYQAWIWFISYIPLAAFVIVLIYCWRNYFTNSSRVRLNTTPRIQRWNLLLLLVTLSLIAMLWLTNEVFGWKNFYISELVLALFLFVFSFIAFTGEGQFPNLLKPSDIARGFDHFNDDESLQRLQSAMTEMELYTDPSLSLKTMSQELELPERYVSYLINRYHQKNFKRFINDYRVDAFIAKAKSTQVNKKTLVALALESGFNSKSTFNQVFKQHTGQSPTDYLR